VAEVEVGGCGEGDCGAEVWANNVTGRAAAATSSSIRKKRSMRSAGSVVIEAMFLREMRRASDIRVRKLLESLVRRSPSDPGWTDENLAEVAHVHRSCDSDLWFSGISLSAWLPVEKPSWISLVSAVP
jgi:hypothetical protein